MPQFLDDVTYSRLVSAYTTAFADIADPDTVKIWLGEKFDIWPLRLIIVNLEDGLDRNGDPIGDC